MELVNALSAGIHAETSVEGSGGSGDGSAFAEVNVLFSLKYSTLDGGKADCLNKYQSSRSEDTYLSMSAHLIQSRFVNSWLFRPALSV